MDLKEILKKGTNLPTAENHFIIDSDVSVELYTSKIDQELEKKVKKVIIDDILSVSNNDDEIEISQNREYIESEQMYMTIYDFNLIEKGGI